MTDFLVLLGVYFVVGVFFGPVVGCLAVPVVIVLAAISIFLPEKEEEEGFDRELDVF